MSRYKDIYDATTSIKSILRYDAIIDESGIIYKDCGDYLQMIVPVKTKTGDKKDHDTYEIHYDSNGSISKIVGHYNNTYFTGTKYY